MISLQNQVIMTIMFCSLCRCQDFRSKQYKHILLWDEPDGMPMSLFMQGDTAFQIFDCPVSKCYVTSNKDFFHGSMKNFDAIVFNGKSSPNFCAKHRYGNQKYIFASTKPETEPVCNGNFDGFFNWTASHRLNSDFIFSFILMKNATGHIVGPRSDTEWVKNMRETDPKFANMLQSKTKLAAWFVANCTSKHRNEFVKKLQEALQKYDLSIDIFGRCGNLHCAKSECFEILKRDYFFYLALESIQTKDYVTEKIIPALQNYVIPIVYSETDYSRFLPPNSYLNGKKLSVDELARKMKNLMESPLLYQDYFKWRRYYRFVASTPEGGLYKGKGICDICEALHNEDMSPTDTIVREFRRWWDPNFEKHCRDHEKNQQHKQLRESTAEQSLFLENENGFSMFMTGEKEPDSQRNSLPTQLVISFSKPQVPSPIPPVSKPMYNYNFYYNIRNPPGYSY